jgi:hypothetical protein
LIAEDGQGSGLADRVPYPAHRQHIEQQLTDDVGRVVDVPPMPSRTIWL